MCLAIVRPCGAETTPFGAATGYDQLVAENPGMFPTGAGVPISIVEADADRNPDNVAHLYLPNSAATELIGKAFINGSSVTSPGVSNHATDVASNFVGATLSVAPGVSNITVYEADDYLNNVLRMTPSNAGPPIEPTFKVQNHSWVGSFDDNKFADIEALRRFDYVVDTIELTAVVGLANGSTNSHPTFFSHSYNGIAVGRSDGEHSRGLTSFAAALAEYGNGRSKPDIVAPLSTTSYATAAVSSAAAMLYQSATDSANFANADPDAARSETMRAILMAGATKDEFPGWQNSSPTQPLDLVYGAGELNVRNSFYIQQGGQQNGAPAPGGPAAASFGWDYGSVDTANSQYYHLTVPDQVTDATLSVILAWNVAVTDQLPSSATFSPLQSLTNLDLELWDSSGSQVLAQSISEVDNVEHIYLTDLDAGDYTLKVLSKGGSRDFGLAWRLHDPDSATGDFNRDGLVNAADYTYWRNRLGSQTEIAADANHDGVVNDADYDVWRLAYGANLNGPSAALAGAQLAPEPGGIALLALCLGLLAPRRR